MFEGWVTGGNDPRVSLKTLMDNLARIVHVFHRRTGGGTAGPAPASRFAPAPPNVNHWGGVRGFGGEAIGHAMPPLASLMRLRSRNQRQRILRGQSWRQRFRGVGHNRIVQAHPSRTVL